DWLGGLRASMTGRWPRPKSRRLEKSCPGSSGSNVDRLGDVDEPRKGPDHEPFRLSLPCRPGTAAAGHGDARTRPAEPAGVARVDARPGGEGTLEEPGPALSTSGNVVRGRNKLVTDGPYVEAKDLVLGFIVVAARDLAEAAELAKGCPMLQGDGSVEVRRVEVMIGEQLGRGGGDRR